MRKRLSYKEQHNKMQLARAIELGSMEHSEPIPEATRAFARKPYSSLNVMEYINKIREGGKQNAE